MAETGVENRIMGDLNAYSPAVSGPVSSLARSGWLVSCLALSPGLCQCLALSPGLCQCHTCFGRAASGHRIIFGRIPSITPQPQLATLVLTIQRRIGAAKRLSLVVVARITPIAKERLSYSLSGFLHELTFVLGANANGVFDQLPPRGSTLQLPAIFLGRKNSLRL